MDSNDFDNALLAAKENRVHEWVLSFLRASGNNSNLANKLEEYGKYCYGPITYPLQEIANIFGPDDTYKYSEDARTLTKKVNGIVESIKDGWRPPPLLATNLWENYLELADGGHRYRAFQRLAITEYVMILYFRDKASLDEFVSTL